MGKAKKTNWPLLLFALAGVVLLLGSFAAALASESAEPTLARLSVWLPSAQHQDFAATYEQELVPLLQVHGLQPVDRQGRATADSIFTRLLAIETPEQVVRTALALEADPQWQQALRQWTDADTLLRYRLGLYSTPAGPGRAAPMGSGTSQGLWKRFSVQDGLPDGWINTLLQDRDGDLWIGTNSGGLVRYDGERFTTYTRADGLGSDAVRAMAKDEDGRLWIAARGALSRYDQQGFTSYNSEDGLGDLDTFSRVSLLLDRRGALWVGGEGWVSRWDGQTFKPVFVAGELTEKIVTALFEDHRGILWIGTRDGLYRFDGQRLKPFTRADGLCHNHVTALAEDGAGQLWIGTRDGLSRYDGQDFTTFNFFSEHGLREYAYTLLVDRAGQLWAGGADGLIRYDGRKAIAFTSRDGLGSSGVITILEDRDGLLWLGTQSGGLLRYDGCFFQHFTTADGLPTNYIFALYQDRGGNLWFGGSGGVTRYDGKQLRAFTREDGLGTGAVAAIHQDRRSAIAPAVDLFLTCAVFSFEKHVRHNLKPLFTPPQNADTPQPSVCVSLRHSREASYPWYHEYQLVRPK